MNTVPNQEPRFKSQRPLPVPAPVRNPLTLALFWLSKTDPRLVSVCSRWAMATQAAFGFFVAFTGLLAFGAAYYTLSTLSVNTSLVPWIAVGWACFIVACDREIAGSLDKTTAVIRPFLALFLGTLTAIPLELYVFEKRVDQELQRQYRQDNKEQLENLDASRTQLDQRRTEMQTTMADLRRQDADWGRVMDQELAGRSAPGRTGVRGAGPVFDNAQTQQRSVQQRILEVRRDLDQLNRSIPEQDRRSEDRFKREEVARTSDFTTRLEAMDKVVHSSAPLFRLSWLLMLTVILCETTPALLKILTPHVDYHHLVNAEIRENCTRVDEISDRNYRLAMENPEVPRLSVVEKFILARYSPISNVSSFGKRYETKP